MSEAYTGAPGGNPKYTYIAGNYYDGTVSLNTTDRYIATAAFVDMSGPYYNTHVVSVNKGVMTTISGGGIFSGGAPTLTITKPFNGYGGYIVVKEEL